MDDSHLGSPSKVFWRKSKIIKNNVYSKNETLKRTHTMALQNSSIDEMNLFLNRIYYIPNYQREYSWENDELDDFWNDLLATKKDKDDIHFFGQIVVHDDQDDKKKYIIDGQQRTTTSMIFLRSLQIFFDEMYQRTKDKKLGYYNSIDIEGICLGREEERHLTLSDLDNNYFDAKVLSCFPQKDSKEKKKSHERLRKAYVFFNNKISGLIEDINSDQEKYEELTDLYKTFIRRFKVLYMETTKLEEAFIIFETLNARGKDLETADLLKNYILNHSKNINDSLKRWNSMVSKLEKCDPTKYIRHYWNATQDFEREKALYRAINKRITTPKDSREMLNHLDELAKYYHDMVIPSENTSYENSKLIESFSALKALKASTFYPVVLAMKKNKSFKEDDIAKVVSKIEIYVFRNFTICGRTANSAETYFASIAKSIENEELTNADEICTKINKDIVSDDEFKISFISWTGSSSSKEAIRYILRKIHKHLDPLKEISVDNNDVHIEHIMPENNEKWKISEDVHERVLWRLGNLALMSGPFNQSIHNDPFNDKYKAYTESIIKPNNEILSYAKQEDSKYIWTEDSINARQTKLSEYALEIWRK